MKKRTYDATDILIEEIAEEYDAQGNLLKKLVYDGIKNYKVETAYTYNAEGKWIEVANTYEFCDSGMGDKSVIKYNEKQQPIRRNFYTLEGTLLWYMEHEYEGDLEVKTTMVIRDPRKYEYWIYAYDEEGRRLSKTYYNSNDEVTEVHTWVWENGFHVKTLSSKGSYTVFHRNEDGTYLGYSDYDEEGNLVGSWDDEGHPRDFQ